MDVEALAAHAPVPKPARSESVPRVRASLTAPERNAVMTAVMAPVGPVETTAPATTAHVFRSVCRIAQVMSAAVMVAMVPAVPVRPDSLVQTTSANRAAHLLATAWSAETIAVAASAARAQQMKSASTASAARIVLPIVAARIAVLADVAERAAIVRKISPAIAVRVCPIQAAAATSRRWVSAKGNC